MDLPLFKTHVFFTFLGQENNGQQWSQNMIKTLFSIFIILYYIATTNGNIEHEVPRQNNHVIHHFESEH